MPHCRYLVADRDWWNHDLGPGRVTKCVPAYATTPLPGIQPVLVNEKNEIIEETESEGALYE